MRKPREKTREELAAEIEDGKKKTRQFENRKKMLRQKLSKEKRRTHSHRLIVRGAVFEPLRMGGQDYQNNLQYQGHYYSHGDCAAYQGARIYI